MIDLQSDLLASVVRLERPPGQSEGHPRNVTGFLFNQNTHMRGNVRIDVVALNISSARIFFSLEQSHRPISLITTYVERMPPMYKRLSRRTSTRFASASIPATNS